MSVTIFRQSKAIRRTGSLVHSAVALAFLVVPMAMFGYFLFAVASSTVSGANESIANNKLADRKVRSQHGVLFDEGVISITFDDGWKSVATNAAPIMGEYRMVSTQYIITDSISTSGYMSLGQLKALKAAGHEIGSHSAGHLALADQDDDSLDYEFTSSKARLEKLGLIEKGESVNFAYPYGSKSEHTNTIGAKTYISLRGAASGLNDGVDSSDINTADSFSSTNNFIGMTIDRDTKLSQIKDAIRYAKEHKGWLVINFHQIDNEDTEFSVSPENFRTILLAIQDANIKTMTVKDALASIGGV